MTKSPTLPQLCLVTTLAAAIEAPDRLVVLVQAAKAATVVMTDCRAAPDNSRAQAAVAAITGLGVAVLIENDAELALQLGADGVHLTSGADIEERYAACRRLLGASRIVGADAGSSRHDAMTLGESGADYVAFGPTSAAAASADDGARQIDLITWWADVFVVPVVAYDPQDLEAAAALAAAGAEFIALHLPAASAIADSLAYINGVRSALGLDSAAVAGAAP